MKTVNIEEQDGVVFITGFLDGSPILEWFGASAQIMDGFSIVWRALNRSSQNVSTF
jgi:hypothetical protein